MKVTTFDTLISRPRRKCLTFMPRSKRPEHTRKKAMRSRWAGSMFAWILKTKPVNGCSDGATERTVASRSRGAGAQSTSAERISRTPKLLIAEPKNTGVCTPERNSSRLNGFDAPCTSSTSMRSWSISSGNISCRRGLSMPLMISKAPSAFSSPALNSMISSFSR